MDAAGDCMTIRCVDTGSAVIVSVGGEVDLATAPVLRETLQQMCSPQQGKPVVLDLSDVEFLASDGLAVLVDTADYARARSVGLRIVTGTSRRVLHPLELTGLDAVLPLYPTLPDALGPDRDCGAGHTGATTAVS